MYRNTRFGELMKALPRDKFSRLVREHQSDKYCKGFSSWDQLVAMIYGQLSGIRSLRELETTFNGHRNHHYHLGTRSVHRSTLADANARRDCKLYEVLCGYMLEHVSGRLRTEVRNMLFLLDSTSITLAGRGYDDWTGANHNHFTHGVKVHVLYEPVQALPRYINITAPNVNDIEDARTMEICSGAVYVFDKGYYDYSWWHRLDESGARFVTRFKRNAGLKVERSLEVCADDGILADEQVQFRTRQPRAKHINPYYGKTLRRITVRRPEGRTPLILATNDLQSSAAEIAALYKKRWDIELFFKWLKQNLKIKTFLGRSENAVRTQLYIALITYLLLWMYHHTNQETTSLKQCMALLSIALFQRPETAYAMYRRRKRWRDEMLQKQGKLL